MHRIPYTQEQRDAHLKELMKETRRTIEGNIPERVKRKHPQYDCVTLLANSSARKTEPGDLIRTSIVLGELIEYEARRLGYVFLVEVITKEFNSEKNTFWVECEIVSLPEIEEDLEKERVFLKKMLRRLWSQKPDEEIDLITERVLQIDIEEVLRMTIGEKYKTNIEFGSPPQR